MVEGLRRPDAGEVRLLGEPTWPRNPRLLPRIGVQLQASAFFERLTAREQIRTFASLYGVPAARADEWLERVGLDRQGGHPHRASCPAASCSGSRSPARSCTTPRWSSSTSRRRPSTRRRGATSGTCCAASTTAGRTVVLTTHYMDEAETLCDRVAIMDHGRILELDTPGGPGARPRRAGADHGRRRSCCRRASPARSPGVETWSRSRAAVVLTHPGPVRRAARAGRADALERAPGAGRAPSRTSSSTSPAASTGRERPSGRIALAIVKGFLRDRTVGVLRGGLPADVPGAVRRGLRRPVAVARSTWCRSATVPLIDQLPGGRGRRSTRPSRSPAAPTWTRRSRRSRKGDADVAVEMQGDTLVAHYTQTDQVRAAVTQGTLDAFVNGANQAATGQPPRYTLARRAGRGRVPEDDPVRDPRPARVGGRDERRLRRRRHAAGLAQQQAAAAAPALARAGRDGGRAPGSW